ncbi:MULTISPECIES: DUF1707 domain-containing protein [unclassified Crossiella]|uniref:DUF1707 SHOCT-like domain-containing protein n=1 Tax=unclassified Crossiella TaxID=2620835 RepID=UPI001FFEAF4E|nr:MULTISPECIES: DUF1707 domain-containing protein [unclassified Crossiella]MCK2238352.1 DUF1707 domain-containing protein [Crossiella sp. S99.2]MCK2256392.1 DUF1707 domain-containing protein [Crossiella sp. S99.1]
MSTHGDHVELRIGDTERTEAERLLGEHLRVGRLTAEEFGERANIAVSARTRRELSMLFEDLPAPHPTFELPAPLQYQPLTEQVAMPMAMAPMRSQANDNAHTVAKVLAVLIGVPVAGLTLLAGGGFTLAIVDRLPASLAMLTAAAIGVLVLAGIVAGVQRFKPK